MQPEELFSIGELAKQLDISTRTIRYYEERGLIKPRRSDGGQRIYTRRDRGRLKLILRARRAGFDLEESKAVLDLYDVLPSDRLHQAQATRLLVLTDRRLTELDQKIKEMTQLRDELRHYRESLAQVIDGQN